MNLQTAISLKKAFTLWTVVFGIRYSCPEIGDSSSRCELQIFKYQLALKMWLRCRISVVLLVTSLYSSFRDTHYIIDCLCTIGVEHKCFLPLSISSISNVFVMFSPLMKLSAEHVCTPKSLKRTLSMVIVSL